jgi:hypothetical protein
MNAMVVSLLAAQEEVLSKSRSGEGSSEASVNVSRFKSKLVIA